MKLLFIVSRIPYPLDKGDKLRAFHQLNILAQNHEITLICLTDQKPHPEAFAFLKSRCANLYFFKLGYFGIIWRLFKGLFNQKPFQVNYFFSKKVAKKINRIIEKNIPDFIGCQLIRTSEYCLKYTTIPKFIDFMDCLSAGMQKRHQTSKGLIKILTGIEYERLKNYENLIHLKFSFSTIIAEQDLALLPIENKKEVYIIKNGVDFNYFNPVETQKSFDVLFTGNMAYPPNIDAALYLIQNIMPLVWQTNKDIKVVICGINPDSKLLALKSKNVVVTGWVDDIRTYYLKSLIFIAPMRIGSGLQNKLLEAMAMKIPSITTPLANNALKAKNNLEVLVGETEQELANLILKLHANQTLRKSLAENALNFVKNEFSWQNNTSKLNSLLEKHFN